ncbi:MAG: sel1 repeat family protein [Cocleimonas sp.]|nr:sel1 repeat family protein [Cocleimonas sp.]
MIKQLLPFISLLTLTATMTVQATASTKECQQLFDQGLYQQADIPCTTAAKADDIPAQVMLGEIKDRAGDSKQTAFWWSKAAKAGSQSARNLLALKYYYGGTVFGSEKGWTQDYSKAFKIWQEDANENVASSQFMIGVMYQKGLGVEKNLAESWFWLKRALENGYKLATDVLIEISREITPQQKQAGKQKLLEYKQKAEKQVEI